MSTFSQSFAQFDIVQRKYDLVGLNTLYINSGILTLMMDPKVQNVPEVI